LTAAEPNATSPPTSKKERHGDSGGKATKPAIVGTWMIDVDRSLKDVSKAPDGLSRHFDNIDAYRNYLKPKIENGRFEVHADGTAIYRWGRWTQKMRWEDRGNNKYWIGYKIPFAFSVGHIITIEDDGSGICKFQVDYSESVAPRSPLFVTKSK
jgi:hypothetical protein